jgi:hypothetical protein
MLRIFTSKASDWLFRGLAILAALAFSVLSAPAQQYDFEERMIGMGVEGPAQPNNILEFGFLTSGGAEQDLEDGIFSWDYATYLYYRYRIDEKSRLRFNHQMYKYLDGEDRNTYSVDWRRELKAFQAFSISGEFSDDSSGYQSGTAYFGYQGLCMRDLQWYARVGAGADSDSQAHGNLYLEAIKPLTQSTLLRFSNSSQGSSSGYWSDSLRLNIIQALSRQLALNVGFRVFADRVPDGGIEEDVAGEKVDDADDFTSYEINSALVCLARENLSVTGQYRYYWNSEDTIANIFSLGGRWRFSKRQSVKASYQAAIYDDAPVSHGIEAGYAIEF